MVSGYVALGSTVIVIVAIIASKASLDHLAVFSASKSTIAAVLDEKQPSECQTRRNHGECTRLPLLMAHKCPLWCEEDLAESRLRNRFVLRDVVPATTVALLARLAPKAVVLGDGYDGKERSLSKAEFFGGVTPTVAARWAKQRNTAEDRQEAMDWARAYINATSLLQHKLEATFNRKLSFDFIHLTCRTRDSNFSGAESDSHVTHADNCFDQGEKCIRESPMYFWRSHSCILSLHNGEDDFDGGAFFFTPTFDSNRSQRVRIVPKAGSAVSFSAGEENIHGVEAVTRGTRCQLSLWMTEDHKKAAHARELKDASDLLETDPNELQEQRDEMVEKASRRYQELCKSSNVSAARRGRHVAELPLRDENRNLSVDILHEAPQISQIRNFLRPEEIKHLLTKAAPKFKRAVVFEGDSLAEVKYRTSETSWLKDDPNDPVITRVLDRIKLVTGLKLASSEQLQVAYYTAENQGRYEPHLDWGVDKTITRDYSTLRTGEPVGARVATFLVYFNEVEAGGDTAFTWNNISVIPEAGSAIFWYNLHPGREGDTLVHHGACPVLKGKKYIMTKWIHEHGNEAIFDAAMGMPRLARDWPRLAASLRGESSEQEPFVEGHHCDEHVSSGQCMIRPVAMARACPGRCEERSVDSQIRGRSVINDVIKADMAQALIRLVSDAGKPGDGHDGRTKLYELTLGDAARWAVSQQSVSKGSDAAEAVHIFLDAAVAMQEKAAEHLQISSLSIDKARLVCREADELLRPGADWIYRDKAIAAGDDIVVENMTEVEAKKFCSQTPECEGFTYKGAPTNEKVLVYVKSKFELYGKGYGWTTYLKAKEPEVHDSEPAHADDCKKTDPATSLFSRHDGFIEQGDDILHANMTIEAAKQTCQTTASCKGFTYKGSETDGPVEIYFKSKFVLQGTGWTSYQRMAQEECSRSSPLTELHSHAAELFLHGPESGDFAGGDLFYTPTWESPVAERIRIKPHVGRMAAYVVGSQNIHGTEEITRGKRCSLTASFLLMRRGDADEIEVAREILANSNM